MNNFLEKINEKKYQLILARDYNYLKIKYQLSCELCRIKSFTKDIVKSGKKYCRKLTLNSKTPITCSFEKFEGERQMRVRRDLVKFFSSDEQTVKLLNAYKIYINQNTSVVKLNQSHKKDEAIIDGLRFNKNENLESAIVEKMVSELTKRKFNTQHNAEYVYKRFLQDRRQKIKEREACTNSELINIYYYKNENQYIEGLLLKALAEYTKNKGRLCIKEAKLKQKLITNNEENPTSNNREHSNVINSQTEKVRALPRIKTTHELENEKLLSLFPNSVQEYWTEL